MRVKDILRHKGDHVISVNANDSLTSAIRLMHRESIGAVAVLSPRGGLLGMLSEREVVTALARELDRALLLRCADVMLSNPPICRPEATIQELAKTMTQARVRHLPVVSEDELLGIISIGDITKAQLNEKELENNVLQDLLRGARGATA